MFYIPDIPNIHHMLNIPSQTPNILDMPNIPNILIFLIPQNPQKTPKIHKKNPKTQKQQAHHPKNMAGQLFVPDGGGASWVQ